MIEQPGLYDIICNCRSQKSFDHVGNRRFRVMIENHSLSYDAAKSKVDKGLIVTSILRTIHDAGGNFIRKPHKHANHWEILTVAQTKEKIGHALRDAIVSQVKELSRSNPSGRNIYSIIGGSRGNKLQPKNKTQLSLKTSRGFKKPYYFMIEGLANSTRPRARLPQYRYTIPEPTFFCFNTPNKSIRTDGSSSDECGSISGESCSSLVAEL